MEDRYFDGFNDALLVVQELFESKLKDVRKGWDSEEWDINPVKNNLQAVIDLIDSIKNPQAHT